MEKGKTVMPIITRSEKLKNFRYLGQCAEKYFNDLNENTVIPPNFATS